MDSIQGIIKYILVEKLPSQNDFSVNGFCQKYEGSSIGHPIDALKKTYEGFKEKNSAHLDAFKTCRDKLIAHRESDFKPSDLPSYDVMECLFGFGADFYYLISEAFIGGSPAEIEGNRPIMGSLKRIFKMLGLFDIKTDFED